MTPQLPNAATPNNASEQLNIPSILLMLLAGLGIPFALLSLFRSADAAQLEQLRQIKGMSPELIKMMTTLTGPLSKLMNLFGLTIDGFVIFAAIQMRQLKNWPIAVAGSAAAILPFGSCCCCISMGIGIWSLVLLMKPEIKSQFT